MSIESGSPIGGGDRGGVGGIGVIGTVGVLSCTEGVPMCSSSTVIGSGGGCVVVITFQS